MLPWSRAFLIAVTLIAADCGNAHADGLFSDDPDADERAAFGKGAEAATKALEALGRYKDAFRIRQMQGGDCDPALEIETEANSNNAQSQLFLAKLYATGLCTPKDLGKSFTWLSKASDLGNAEATRRVGLAFQDGLGVSQNQVAAAQFMQKAADAGDTTAMLGLGNYFIEGRGVPKDPASGIAWMEQAAEKGDLQAGGVLGWVYQNPDVTQVDLNKALKYSLPSAERGLPLAQLMAGFAVKATGNLVEAHKWFNLAAASAEPSVTPTAGPQRDALEQSMTPDDLAKARKLASAWKPTHDDVTATATNQATGNLPDYPLAQAVALDSRGAIAELTRLNVPITKSAFQRSIQQDKVGVFALFHRAGASLETKFWPGGRRPLFASTDYGAPNVFAYLLSNGAAIDALSEGTGQSALTRAIGQKRWDMATALLDRGASAKQLPEWRGGGNDKDPLSGGTPLLYAVWNKDLSIAFLDRLFSAGASVDERYGLNKTPLENAISAAPEVFQYLLDRGADPNAEDDYHQSILWHFVETGQVESKANLVALMKAGAKIDWTNKETSPLLVMAWLGNADVVRTLVEAGARPDLAYQIPRDELPAAMSDRDKVLMGNGGTALMLAAQLGNAAVCRALVTAGADANKVATIDGEQVSAASIAQGSGNALLMQALKPAN